MALKRLALVGLLGGLGLTVWLVVHVGAPQLAAALGRVGWRGLLAIAGFHLIATTAMGLAWWRLRRSGRPWIFIWGRLVRDAGSEVLALSQLGGSVLGARATMLQGIGGTLAGASTIIDATLEFGAQIAFAAVGLGLLVVTARQSRMIAPLAAWIAIAGVAALTIVAIERRGMQFFPRPLRALAWAARAASVQAEMRAIFDAGRVLPSFLLHLAAWLLSGVEAWLALRFMGVTMSPIAVLIMESMIYAGRAMVFVVPNAMGVQEGIYILLGAAFGLSPDAALGLSLLKRGRDLVLGVPALATWQVVENRGWLGLSRSLPQR